MAEVPPNPEIDELEFARTAEAVRRRLFDLAPEPIKLGRYSILERIGAGAMGTVFTAYDPKLDRKVAVKLIRSENVVAAAMESRRRRLAREAKALAQVTHPNVVTVYDVGTFEDQVFISMEYVEGRDMRRWIATTAPEQAAIVSAFEQAARGLAAAHRAGVVHRDVKPDNILVGDDGRVRITDFGLATAPSSGSDPLAERGGLPATDEHGSLTVDGVLVGTPAYMAPEQLDGAEADERSDQFGFCVSLYEALAGKRPFAGASWTEVLASMRQGAIEPLAAAPQPVRQVLTRGLSANPRDRYPSMDALLKALADEPARLPAWTSWTMIGLAIAALAGVVAVLAGPGRDERRCANARDHLVGVWDEPTRERVRSGLLGSKVPYAIKTWEQVSAALDQYTDAWTTMHSQSCRATRVSGEQSERLMDLRMACLGDLRRQLRATTDVLAEADAAVAARAARLVHELGRVSACADTAALTSQVPPPRAPQKRAAIDALRPGLARAGALLRAGRYREGITGATEIAERAAAINFKPMMAEAYYTLGRLQVAQGHNQAAERSLVIAVRAAQASGHTEMFARSSISLIALAAQLVSLERGRLWSGLAQAAIERLNDPAALQAARLSVWSNVLHHHGKYDEAIAAQREAVELMTRAGRTDEPAYAHYLHNLGNIHHSRGQHDRAREHLQEALGLRQRLLGTEHPDVATTLNSLAIVAEDKGDKKTALQLYRRALEVAERALGANHANVANYLDNISGILKTSGKMADALTNRQRALSIREKVFGSEHPDVAISLNNLGSLFSDMGRRAEALSSFRRSLAIRIKHFGPKSTYLIPVVSNIGDVQMQLGQHKRGLANHFRSVALADELLGREHADLTYYLRMLGEALLLAKRATEAITHLERAITIGEATKTFPGDLDGSRLALARALWATGGDRKRALELARRARDGFTKRKDDKATQRATAWLASRN